MTEKQANILLDLLERIAIELNNMNEHLSSISTDVDRIDGRLMSLDSIKEVIGMIR
jgi:hypothetical protein